MRKEEEEEEEEEEDEEEADMDFSSSGWIRCVKYSIYCSSC